MTSILRTVVRGLAVTGGAAIIALGTAGMASAAPLPTTPSVSVLTVTPVDGAAPVVLRVAAGNEFVTLTAGPTGQLRVTAESEPMQGADVVANESGTGVTVRITRDGVVEHDVLVGNDTRWWCTA